MNRLPLALAVSLAAAAASQAGAADAEPFADFIQPAAVQAGEEAFGSGEDDEWDQDLDEIFGDEPTVAEEVNPDPLEKINRFIYRINATADRYLLVPVAKGYRAVVPTPARDGVRNFTGNVDITRSTLHLVLQGKVAKAGVNLSRFLLNLTLGFGGLFDPASDMGIPRYSEDFGQTLGVWGIGPGPYIVVPFLGPSTVRDFLARFPDSFLHPQTELETEDLIAYIAVDLLALRESLLGATEILTGDQYIAFRDAYLSRRQWLVTDGKLPDAEEEDLFDDELFDDEFFDEELPEDQSGEGRALPGHSEELFAVRGWDSDFPYPVASYSPRRRLLALARQSEALATAEGWAQMPPMPALDTTH